MNALAEYAKKRHFGKTNEPAPGIPHSRRAGPLRFVIQKHAARRLHYDFRLEADGVLKSWAIPKGPSLDPAEKRLAVMVEDHPLDYADFEGTIAEGGYGAGEVIVWDSGTYMPLHAETPLTRRKEAERRVLDGIEKGKIVFRLNGVKLHGDWVLVRTRVAKGEWLLIKQRDELADSSADVLESDRSVLSGRTVEELAD